MVDNQLQTQMDRAIESGRDNAAVRTGVEGWCTHLTMEVVGVSPLGQSVGLPIGPHRLVCPHAEYSTEGVVLRRLFQRFLTDHCLKCPHHQPGTSPDFGRSMVEETRVRLSKAREAEQRRLERIENVRTELTALADLRANASQPESASVFRLTADLFSGTGPHVTQMLREASGVAPELFEDKVMELLFLGASHEAFAERCLPILSQIVRSRPQLKEKIRPAGIGAAQFNVSIELLAECIDACLSHDASEVNETTILKLISTPNYQTPIGGWKDDEEPTFDATISLLVKLVDIDAARVSSTIAELLKSGNKWTRANACRVIQELAKLRPDFGVSMLKEIAQSLELDDDIFEGVSADGSAVATIAELLALRWRDADRLVVLEKSKLSVAAQAVLIEAYGRLFLRRNWRDESTEGLDEAVVAGAVARCLAWLNDAAEEPAIRRSAAESLLAACRAGARSAFGALDQMMGCLAIIVESAPPPPAPTIILPGEESSLVQREMLARQDRQSEWTNLKRELKEAIEEIGEHRPLEVASTLVSTIENATAGGHIYLRRIAVDMLGKAAYHDSGVVSIALPTLMKCLMDYSSPVIRAVAIDAVREAFRHSVLTMPSNVVDMLITHLRDEMVVVHRAAIGVFRFFSFPLTEQQRREAFSSLLNAWQYYANDKSEKFFMDSIAESLLSVAGTFNDLKATAVGYVCALIPTGEALVDSKLCTLLMRVDLGDSEVNTTIARALIRSLRKHNGNDYKSGRDWREDAGDWLSGLAEEKWAQVKGLFIKCARHVVRRDPGETILFAAVFCERLEHSTEVEILSLGAEAAEKDRRFGRLHSFLRELQSCAVMATGEAST